MKRDEDCPSFFTSCQARAVAARSYEASCDLIAMTAFEAMSNLASDLIM